MKTAVVFAIAGHASAASPIDKIITMNGDLEQEIVKKVEDTHAGYAEFAELCEELLCLRSR